MQFYEMTNHQILKEIGQRIKRKRLNKNMSQDDLASRAGLSRRTISLAESNGQRWFQSDHLHFESFKKFRKFRFTFSREKLKPNTAFKIKGLCSQTRFIFEIKKEINNGNSLKIHGLLKRDAQKLISALLKDYVTWAL